MPNLSIHADLHLHTVASDGELTPEELVDEAVEAGLGALAITDHDSIGSIAAAQVYAPTVGLEVIPGCELTIYDGPVEFHLLALFFDPSLDGPFQKFLDSLQRTRMTRALEMVQKLRAVGVEIEEQDVLDARGPVRFGRQAARRSCAGQTRLCALAQRCAGALSWTRPSRACFETSSIAGSCVRCGARRRRARHSGASRAQSAR